MSFYGSRLTHFVEGKNEEDVRKKLLTVGATLQQKLEVINVYHNSATGKIVAWYFHDVKVSPLPPTGASTESEPKVTKKKAKKKTKKKVN